MSAKRPDETVRPESRGGGAPVLPLPRPIDLDHAFHVYVAGRNRMWTEDEKRSAAVNAGNRAKAALAVTSSDVVDPVPGTSMIGVPVPDRLAFHRSASTWRSAVPGGPSRSGSAETTD